MPLYDYQCDNCGHTEEQRRDFEFRDGAEPCSACSQGWLDFVFTPTKNFLIPARFKRDANWHMPNGERSADSAPFSDTNSIRTPKRPSFREKFEENWRKH